MPKAGADRRDKIDEFDRIETSLKCLCLRDVALRPTQLLRDLGLGETSLLPGGDQRIHQRSVTIVVKAARHVWSRSKRGRVDELIPGQDNPELGYGGGGCGRQCCTRMFASV